MILRDFTSADMALVEKNGIPRVCAPGDAIIHEGEAGSSFFLILDGKVEVRKRIGLDKHRKLVELGPLDIFGEVCFLGVESRSASVIALEKALVMEFPRSRIEDLIAKHPEIGLKLYRGIARELARRLATVDGELKDALVWALGDHVTPASGEGTGSRKLSVAPPPPAGEPARIVIV